MTLVNTLTSENRKYSKNQKAPGILIILFSVRGLAAGDFDIIMGDLTIVPSRLQLIEFSVPFQTSDVIIIKKQSTALDSNIFAVAQPLAGEVWLAIFASIILGLGSCEYHMF